MLYFDYNATTPVAPEVAAAMATALRDVFGNASSTHRFGQAARQQLESARRKIAGFLGAAPSDLVLTSGGTESNNLAILGLFRGMARDRMHAVTSTIEHPSVLECFRQLERDGVEVSYVGPGADGIVDAAAISNAMTDRTFLVSLMHANNETGAIQPIREVAALVQQRRAAGQKIYLHSDGAQAFGKIGTTVAQTGADLYSISGHKLYAPKGVGALYVARNVPLQGVQLGGKHERERRAGTENVPAAIAFARALDLYSPEEAASIAALRDSFENGVLSAVESVEVNGTTDRRLPNTSNLLFRDVSAEALLIALDLEGIAVSTGSACSSGSIDPSPVLLAMGRSKAAAKSSIRFSFGRYNSPQDVDRLTESVIVCVRKLRNTRVPEVQFA